MIWIAVTVIVAGQVATIFFVARSQSVTRDFAKKVGDALLQSLIIRQNMAIQENEQAVEAILRTPTEEKEA